MAVRPGHLATPKLRKVNTSQRKIEKIIVGWKTIN